MKLILAVTVVACAQLAAAYPYYPYYGTNVDYLSYGASDNRGALVMSRFYQPYYNPRAVNAGMASFMYQPTPVSSQGYYQPDKRQTSPDLVPPPQQNEVFYPQIPDDATTTIRTELADPTEKTEIFSTTLKTIVPEITEPEIEEVEEKPRRRVSKKKQVKKPVEEDEEDEEFIPKLPSGVMFPMFFGYGAPGRSSGGAPGITAVANAFSTGRGGVATSHATAYGPPQSAPVKY